METSGTKPDARFDAPFWAVSVIVFFGLASFGCIGFAAMQARQAGSSGNAAIISTDNCPPPPDL